MGAIVPIKFDDEMCEKLAESRKYQSEESGFAVSKNHTIRTLIIKGLKVEEQEKKSRKA